MARKSGTTRPPRTELKPGRAGSESAQVSGWLVRVVLGIAIGGLIALEGGGNLIARYQAADVASGAAGEAVFAVRSKGTEGPPEKAARDFILDKDADFVSLKYFPEKQTLRVTVRKEAFSIIMTRIKSLKKYTVITASHDSSYAGKD